YCHLRALRSLPTRRSSDLLTEDRRVDLDVAVRAEDHVAEAEREPHQGVLAALSTRPRTTGTGSTPGRAEERLEHVPEAAETSARSEEHTSELQSRENLVCR